MGVFPCLFRLLYYYFVLYTIENVDNWIFSVVERGGFVIASKGDNKIEISIYSSKLLIPHNDIYGYDAASG